jgi:hypothetical protein
MPVAHFPKEPKAWPFGRNAMKSRTLVEGRERTFVLILDSAEEAFGAISKFANRETSPARP